MLKARKAEFCLLFITAISGLTYPLVGTAVQNINPIDFVSMRFSLAALFMLLFVWRDLNETNWITLGYGVLLGLANLGCFVFQALALQTLGSGEAAFISSTSVILVPLIVLIFYSQKPTIKDFLCALLCLGGLYILTGANLAILNIGELFALFCAICCTLIIILMQIATLKIQNFKLLVFYQIIFTAIFSFPFRIAHHQPIIWNKLIIFSIMYCVIFATLLFFLLQAKYQKHTSASKAALMFCAEPVFATLYGWLILSEQMTLNLLVGGFIILISISLQDVLKLLAEKR